MEQLYTPEQATPIIIAALNQTILSPMTFAERDTFNDEHFSPFDTPDWTIEGYNAHSELGEEPHLFVAQNLQQMWLLEEVVRPIFGKELAKGIRHEGSHVRKAIALGFPRPTIGFGIVTDNPALFTRASIMALSGIVPDTENLQFSFLLFTNLGPFAEYTSRKVFLRRIISIIGSPRSKSPRDVEQITELRRIMATIPD